MNTFHFMALSSKMAHNKQVSIARAQAQDLAALATLSYEAFAAAYEARVPPAEEADFLLHLQTAFTLAQTEAEWQEPNTTFLLARQTGPGFGGYAKCIYPASLPDLPGLQLLHLDRLYVHPACLRQGIGTALMQAVFEMAQSQQCDGLWLCVWVINQEAKRFYERLGFVQKGYFDFKMGQSHYQDYRMIKEFREVR
ncbi:MAG: GNAT family N-acetyltransferase [Microscillaceae bacterium]|nr:GNAT family N-acetyltransferase [Microscillaceae bacterium]